MGLLPQQPHTSSNSKKLWSGAIGRAGEHLAASVIELHGWGVFIASLQHIDLLAVKGKDVLRVQVKATQGRDSGNQYHFSLNRQTSPIITFENVDIVACVMLDIRQVYFMPAYGLTRSFAVNKKMLALEDMERKSWDAALERCGVAQHEAPT